MLPDESDRKPVAYFTGKGASVTTVYIDVDGKAVIHHRPSKIKRGGRSKVTPAEVEAFKKRRSFGRGNDSTKKHQ